MSSNQALLLNKLKQILTERKQLFQGKVLTLDPLQVIITSNNQIVGCTKLNNVTKNQSVVVFKDLDNKKYYCFSPEVSVTNLNSSVVTYNSFSKRRGKDLVNNYNIYFFLLDVSNSIEMASINKCLQILNNEIEHPLKIKRNDLVGIITFADTVYEYTKYINKPSKKSKVIDILNNVKNAYDGLVNKYDRYTPATFTYADFNIVEDDVDKVAKLDAYSKFWVDEGTDLPENGIDTIISVLNSINKEKVNKYLYIITDNDKYSRNINDVSLILNSKFKKLYFDIIIPVNLPSETIVVQGSETNPYCSNSAISRVEVNDVAIGNYPSGSEILITNSINSLIWDGGSYQLINNNNLYGFSIKPNGKIVFDLTYQIDNNTPINTTVEFSHTDSISYFYIACTFSAGNRFTTNIVENTGNRFKIFSTDFLNAEISLFNFYPDGILDWESFPIYDITFQNQTLSLTINSIHLKSNSNVSQNYDVTIIDPYDINNLSSFDKTIFSSNIQEVLTLVPIQNSNSIMSTETAYELGGYFTSFAYKRFDTSLITFGKELKINNNIIQTLEETDTVKVICQPQVVPLINPNSYLYQDNLPSSNKIIYL